MIFHNPNNETYETGREIGKGGEGTVFEVVGNNEIVLKVYNELLGIQQVEKLRQMVAMGNSAINAYAAWPLALAMDNSNNVCGFVMKKLTGFVPLHMVFSPMDRKNMFPDKGYNFLVHIARNLATAFHKLHEAGLVVGDVNEGNVLINGAGIVNFIDCDSFQINTGSYCFYCEVGVPRYTPPELLRLTSFENVVRTVNTDSFSMAILIFQLLFLGRHPFAGRNKLKTDFDEETAIKQHEFAYSLRNPNKKLLPPNDTFEIGNLNEALVDNFHRAFEHEENRPGPAEWIRAIDALAGNLVTCGVSRIHTYPGTMTECPWCRFRQARGILYFLDDSYLKANAHLNDIEAFVNGFRLEKLEIRKWQTKANLQSLTANEIPKKFKQEKRIRIAGLLAGLVALVVLLPLTVLKIWGGTLYILMLFAYAKRTRNAVFTSAVELRRRKDEYLSASTFRDKLIDEYNNSPDFLTYEKGLWHLEKFVQQFRKLPDEYLRLKKEMEGRVYDEQLHYYLRSFDLEWYTIPAIGTVKKNALAASGIKTAADITLLNSVKVPGIGPKNIQILLSWQRQMSTGFVYMPDDYKLKMGLEKVDKEIDRMKLLLESEIRKSYQSLTYLKLNISNRALVLERRIEEMTIKARQAELDLRAFEKFSRIF